MAAGFDVALRLADGLAAVDDIQTYVSACGLRGYQDPDLTSHGAQVRDWYGSEDGLDLQALDADCAALRAAAEYADQAARLAQQQAGSLSGAWTGTGADAAADFLRRHCDSSVALAQAVHAAAETCAGLRDELWRIVDRRVEATMTVARTAEAHRGVWLAACRSVLAGNFGKEVTEVVETQVKAFVHGVVRGDWVSAMQSATAGTVGAYRTAIDAIRPGHVRFDVPGELGPPAATADTPKRERALDSPFTVASGPERDHAPPVASPPRFSLPVAQPGLSADGPADGVPWHPADAWAAPRPAATPPNAWPGAVPSPSDAWAAGTPHLPPNAFDAWGSPASWPTAGGLPALSGGGLPGGGFTSAMPNTLGDVLGGLLDSVAGRSPDLEPLGMDDPADKPDVLERDDGMKQPPEAGGIPDDGKLEAGSRPGVTAAEAERAVTGTTDAPPTTGVAPEVIAEPPSGPASDSLRAAQPGVASSAPPSGDTPCEIAADELPQAGR